MSSFATVFTTKPFVSLLVLPVGVLVGLIACNSQQASSQNGRYQLQGVIVSVDKPERSVVVKHEEIPGYMSAMTMPYDVADDEMLDKLSPGSQIRADVVVKGGSTRLENIRVIKR